MVTGHEVCRGARVELTSEHKHIFDFISENRDIFPGFFHYDLNGNVLPKLEVLQEFGFYPAPESESLDTESCGAHSPRVDRDTQKNAQEITAQTSAAAIATSA